ncbi:MAG: TonB-dependent receptor plug domain-containing protein [Bacteroidota bacterium]|nr:TonB-dependent receptor plug domain-containing protein [Bacteroidota bacterium]
MIARFNSIFAICLFIVSVASGQQTDTDSVRADQNFYDMTLEQLMGMEVSVASRQSLTTRQSPGVVTLITEEEIKSSGARDLMDLLRRVPGFDFCVDVEGVVGLAVRGNWAHEGKAMLLIDGIEMNENLYSTLQFGNHYPIHNIRRIEIIRGPGSAIYGGNAEYAVINIISKTPAELNGGEAEISYGRTMTAAGQQSTSLALGNQYKDFGFSASLYTGTAIRSDRRYTDFWNSGYDMANHSDLRSNHLNVGMQYKKIKFRGIIDQYSVDTRDNFDKILEKTYRIRFDSYIGELSRDITISPRLILTPRFNLKHQLPWRYNEEVNNEEMQVFYMSSSRFTSGFTSNWNPNAKLNIIGGADYFYDIARQQADALFNSTGTQSLDYNNTSVFAQAILKTNIVDITTGARYNYNDRYAASFVPRLSFTRAFEKMHFKLLYSEAYRAPNTQNIDLNPDIEPEHTTVIEFEAGVKLHSTIYLTGNLYDITTVDPIVYFYDTNTDQEGYRNATRTGTKGLELDLQWKFRKGYFDISYEYYSAAGKNSLYEFEVPGHKKTLLAMPNHEITLSSNFQIAKKYSFSPSMKVQGKRYGVTRIDSFEEPVIESFKPVYLLNLTLRVEEFCVKGLSAGISMFNILDKQQYFIQPYKGGHAALPGASRELVINVTYKFTKK